MRRALSLAEPAGYVRIFLNAGHPIAMLLSRLEPADIKQQAYIQMLLEAFQDCGITDPTVHNSSTKPVLSISKDSGRVPQSAFIEPLRDRELELLRLVANGSSNQEIANELIIAVGTVKNTSTTSLASCKSPVVPKPPPEHVN